mgnify:CR=1 FL=1
MQIGRQPGVRCAERGVLHGLAAIQAGGAAPRQVVHGAAAGAAQTSTIGGAATAAISTRPKGSAVVGPRACTHARTPQCQYVHSYATFSILRPR